MDSGQVAATRSRDEIAAAIRALTPADSIRLRKVPRYYAAGGRIEPEELLQEAFARAMDSRACPAHVTVVKFLAEAMRSIAHGASEKVENRLTLVSVAQTGPHQAEALEIPDPAPTAEEGLITAARCAAIRREILSLFDDDPVARDIVEGSMEEMSAEELRELTGLDQTAYDSKRRLIRRRIDKAYPEGWKP